MAQKRVQVRDLDAPQRIQPAPIQSDTYAPPPKPIKDDNLEKLASSLGFFANKMNALAADQKAEQEKALKEQQLAEWERFKASTSNAEQLDAIKSGKLPIDANGPLSQIIRKHGGFLYASKLAGEVDQDIASGKLPLGRNGFDIDAYLRDKARPYFEEMASDNRLTAYFGEQFTGLRKRLGEAHEKERGKIQSAYIENTARDYIKRTIITAAEAGRDGQQIMDALRGGVYRELGPASHRGALDIGYGKLDDITLDVLSELAEDERIAPRIAQIIHAGRMDAEGKMDIGPLSAANRHAEKVRTIATKTMKTLAEREKRVVKESVLAADKDALLRQDGTAWTLPDFAVKNKYTKDEQIEVSAKQRREDAAKAIIDDIRAQRGGQPDWKSEIAVMQANGMKHPYLGGYLEGIYNGFINTGTKSPASPDQIEGIKNAGLLYDSLADSNWVYAREHLSADARRFFDLYRTLHRFAGRSETEAAAETAIAFANTQANASPKDIDDRRRKLRSSIKSIVTDPIPILGWQNPFKTRPENLGAIERYVEPIADALAMVEGQAADETIKKAIAHVAEKGVNINGRLAVDGFLQKGDDKVVQPFFEKVFKDHAGWLKDKGISDASGLALQPGHRGVYYVVKSDGGVIQVPTGKDKDGKPTGFRPVIISEKDIAKLRSAKLQDEREHGLSVFEQMGRKDDSLFILAP